MSKTRRPGRRPDLAEVLSELRRLRGLLTEVRDIEQEALMSVRKLDAARAQPGPPAAATPAWVHEVTQQIAKLLDMFEGVRDSGLARLFRAERDKTREATSLVVEGLRLQIAELRADIDEQNRELARLQPRLGSVERSTQDLAELRGHTEGMIDRMRIDLGAYRDQLAQLRDRLEDMERWRSGTEDDDDDGDSVEGQLRRLREDVDIALARTRSST